MRRWLASALLAGCCLAAVGCATVPMASPADDVRMKSYRPAPDTALIYLFRDQLFGFAIHMDVTLDRRRYGATVSHSYLVWEVAPGRHVLTSHAENDTEAVIYAAPGRRTYVRQDVLPGILYARSALTPLDEGTGAAGVNDCHLIAMPLPRPAPALVQSETPPAR